MAYNQNRNTQNRNSQSPRTGWREVCNGVSVAGNAQRFSLNWHGAVIHRCRIVNGMNGPFIGWPSYRDNQGDYHNIVYVFAPSGSTEESEINCVIDALTD